MSVSNAVKEACKATGCSEQTIYALKTGLRRHRALSMHVKVRPKRKGKLTNSHKQTYDGIVQSGLRRIVHTFLFANISPTLNAILTKVNSDESLPNFSRSTLHSFLHDIGFEFLRRGNKAAFIERDDII
ncbi:hypothetical protein PR048_003940 [Dryococelus australis]|uniref:Transposase n=1 Tax=Dryococelus australis TaxID=614101 RepID=A0ABQ9I4I7_9NEOP|nr:hypothetical protein PR048_003940 [Dryococelus australis]